jgi:high-affinity iron transporter
LLASPDWHFVDKRIDSYTLSHAPNDANNSHALFNLAIATIFAREVLEACVIIGQYRTAILKSIHIHGEDETERLRAITVAASGAAFVAFLVVLAVAIPLGILSKNLDDHIVMIIEGVSKVVASVCIIQLSLKLPLWLGLYRKVSIFPCKEFNPETGKEVDRLSLKEIRFNVAWNIWREIAECGVFLIPFFLGTEAKAIPLSALAGIAISLVLGIGIYVANNRMTNKFWLAVVMSGLTLFLSVGMFVGGWHEFEELWGESPE